MTVLEAIPMKYRDQTETFPKGWYCVAESHEIGIEAMLSVSYLGQQLIVYRSAEGEARVADAYCPHLGAHLASHDGCITGGEIVCPFHKWRFDAASGKCTSIPYSKVVPPQAKLTLYPTRELGGMVMMWWHPEGGAPDFEPFDPGTLGSDKTWLLKYDKIRMGRVPFRDLFENLFDTAHVQQLHNSSGLPEIEQVTRTFYGLKVDYGAPKQPEQFPLKAMQCNFTGITMMSQIVEGDGFGMLQVASATPLDREQFALRTRLYVQDTGNPELNEMLGGAFVARTDMEIDQDFKVLDYKKHLPTPLICAGDGPINKYREYAREFFA
jgi:3-ketosteroid 9alpha-monooxygenase subunit A